MSFICLFNNHLQSFCEFSLLHFCDFTLSSVLHFVVCLANAQPLIEKIYGFHLLIILIMRMEQFSEAQRNAILAIKNANALFVGDSYVYPHLVTRWISRSISVLLFFLIPKRLHFLIHNFYTSSHF